MIHKAKKSLGLKNINNFVRAKKALGQNFLKSVPALNKIVEAGEISKEDIILEIGPGKGALTEKLLEKSDHVIAVETDRELFEFLKIKFEKEIETGTLILVCKDILKIDMEQNVLERTLGSRNVLGTHSLNGDGQRKFSAENFRGESKNILRNYKIIANIPYNITGAILKKFLTEKNKPERMILMVQNEVAKRIVGEAKNPSTRLRVKESILSISVKAYGEPKIVMKVPARYFSPAPKVDSAIISIKNISGNTFLENKIDEKQFWEIIHAGFAHKRKKLSSNLKKLLINGHQASVYELGNKRAEELTLTDWINLAKNVDLSADKTDINKK